MPEPILIVTYNRLNVTQLEAKHIISRTYREVCAVADAVEALSGGKNMVEGTIYHFIGMGVSAMVCPPEPDPEEKYQRLQSGREEMEEGETETEAVPDSRLEMLVKDSSVSSVCESKESVLLARQRHHMVYTGPPNGNEWNLNRINAHGNTAKEYSGKGVKIAILDTGIAFHEDLNVMEEVSFCEEDQEFQNDDFGHGTHCAGIVTGAKGGIAKQAKLFSIKVATTAGAKPVAILAGLGWALRNRMNIVSISLAGSADLKHIPAFANAVQALMKINCVVVASTGDSSHGVGLPANTPGVLAVGGCDEGNVILNDTNTGGSGNQMTVVAPATNITTTFYREGNTYVRMFGGSSAAAPHVVGLVALIQEKFPGITPLQVIGRILASAQAVKIRVNNKPVYFGEMLIDCDSALSLY